MLVQTLRLQRGWSQEQLATITGLSTRTIQRIERGQTPSLDSLQAIASAFNLDVSDLNHSKEHKMEPQTLISPTLDDQDQMLAFAKVRRLKGFYQHLIRYCVTIAALASLNFITSPNNIWFIWPMLGWGIGIVIHAIGTFTGFTLMGAEWEKRTAERYLGRSL